MYLEIQNLEFRGETFNKRMQRLQKRLGTTAQDKHHRTKPTANSSATQVEQDPRLTRRRSSRCKISELENSHLTRGDEGTDALGSQAPLAQAGPVDTALAAGGNAPTPSRHQLRQGPCPAQAPSLAKP